MKVVRDPGKRVDKSKMRPPDLERDPSGRTQRRIRAEAWRRKGLCTLCGGERDEEGRVTCRACRAKDKKHRDRAGEYKSISNGDGPPSDYDWDAPFRRLLMAWGK